MGPEYFWGGGMWIFPLVFFSMMLIAMVIFSRRGFRGPWQGRGGNQPAERPSEEGALDILKKRYAKGEITKDEFEEMKKDM